MMLEIVPERVRDDFVKTVVLGFALERARPSLVIFELSPRKNTRDPVRERNCFGNRHCASSLLKPLRYAKRRADHASYTLRTGKRLQKKRPCGYASSFAFAVRKLPLRICRSRC